MQSMLLGLICIHELASCRPRIGLQLTLIHDVIEPV